MKCIDDIIIWFANVHPSDIWYSNYGVWGLMSFLFYCREKEILAIIYFTLTIIAYLIATILRKRYVQN